jgi:hypothetical protein
MRRPKKKHVPLSFKDLDLHDDVLKEITIHAPTTRSNSTQIELEFLDDSSGKRKVLVFRNCGNVRYLMDFDVVAANSFASTKETKADSDISRKRRFVHSQTSHWRTRYIPPSRRDRPVTHKMASISRYTLFSIHFFGGTLEVLAMGFSLKGS